MTEEWKSAFMPNTRDISAVLVWIDEENGLHVNDMDVVGWRVEYRPGQTGGWAEPVFLEELGYGFEDWFLISGHNFYKPDVGEYKTRDEAIAAIGAMLVERKAFQARSLEKRRQKLDPPPTPSPSSTNQDST